MEHLTNYIHELKQYLRMAEDLHACLDRHVKLVDHNANGDNFHPTRKTILDQLTHWPTEQSFPLPPSLWIHPRKGEVLCCGETWEFAFHGQGVSFIRTSDRLDVSIEYTVQGELGIEEFNVAAYLRVAAPNLLLLHAQSFAQCIQNQVLVPQSARFGSDSDTYVFSRLD